MTKIEEIKKQVDSLSLIEQQELSLYLMQITQSKDNSKKDIVGMWANDADVIDDIVDEAYKMRSSEKIRDV